MRLLGVMVRALNYDVSFGSIHIPWRCRIDQSSAVKASLSATRGQELNIKSPEGPTSLTDCSVPRA